MKSIHSIDVSNLPVTVSWSDSRKALPPTIFLVVLSSVCTIPLLMYFIKEGSRYTTGLIIVLLVILGSILPLLAVILHREEIQVSKESVFHSKRGLFGTKKWEKPLGEFCGILLFSEFRRTQKHKYTFKRYFLQLYADDGHWIWLFYGDNKNECLEKWKDFARATNLSPMVKTGKNTATLTMEEAEAFDFPE